jgi:hypothetical protein
LVGRNVAKRKEPQQGNSYRFDRVLREESEEGVMVGDMTHVLGSVAGLVGVAWLGEGAIKEMGYPKTAILWSVVVFIGGSIVVFKWAWDKVESAMGGFNFF